jgi:hypothetical protein
MAPRVNASINTLDTGKFAHQIRATPDNQQVIMVTRGNNAPSDKPANPGSIKTFGFKNGVLTNLAAIQPGVGMQFGPRRLPPDAAVGLHFDREPKQAFCLQARSCDRHLARAAVRQGNAQRSLVRETAGRRPDPR